MPPKENGSNRHSDSTYKKTAQSEASLQRRLGLSHTEFQQFKQLGMFTQAELMPLLQARKDMNYFVSIHLNEKINLNPKVTALLNFFLSSDHNLRYSVQKVDELEATINQTLNNIHLPPLFDEKRTQKHRLELLLNAAVDHKRTLSQDIKNSPLENKSQQKLKTLTLLTTAFNKQLHNQKPDRYYKKLLQIAVNDPVISNFLDKLKAIGFNPGEHIEQNKIASNAPTSFKLKIFSVFYKKIYKETTQPDSSDAPKNENPTKR